MSGWLFDPRGNLWVRRVVWEDVGAAAAVAARAFQSPETGDRVRRMLLIHLALGSGDLPLRQQIHTLLPTAYYLLVRGEPAHESVIGLSGLYTRMWDDESEGNYWLGWFAVDPAFQGQGFGERLLTVTMAIAAACGGRRLSIETAPTLQPAVRLYRRLGFTETPAIPDYWGPGADLLLFYRELHPKVFPDLIPPEGILL